MTDEQLALLIDPKRERHPDWWICICKECHGLWQHYGSGAAETASKAQANCNYANHLEGIREYYYTGPPLTTDRVAAFTYITPVLLAAGCDVWEHDKRTTVLDGHGHDNTANYQWPILACATYYQSKHHYPVATTAALAWLKENAPERLRKALEEVGYC